MTQNSDEGRPSESSTTKNGWTNAISIIANKDENGFQIIKLFGYDIRALIEDLEPWFVVSDLSKMFGLHENTIPNKIDNNPEDFEGWYRLAHVTCSREKSPGFENLNQSLLLVNEQTVYLIMGGMSTKRIKNPEAREMVRRFKRAFPELMKMFRKGDLLPATSPVLLTHIIEDRIESCQQVAAAVGCDFTSVLTPELALIEEQTGQKISYLNSLPRQNQYRRAPVFTETELGKQFNVTGTRVKMVLKDKGYLRSIGSRLDFTSVGLLYGEWRPGIEFKGKPRTMVRMRRFWNQDIVPKLEEHFYYLEKAKNGLFTGHLEAIS